MSIPHDPPAPTSIDIINSRLDQQGTEIASIKANMAPQTLQDFPKPWDTWKEVAASYQTVYASMQAFKVDLDGLAATSDGISVLGAQIIKSPFASLIEKPVGSIWQSILEKSDRNAVGGFIAKLFAPDGTVQDFDLKNYRTKTDGHLSRHDTDISELARGQAHLAETAKASATGQAHEAERRSQDRRLRPENAERYRQTAAELNRLTGALDEIRRKADALGNSLGTS
ncbi:hypothetical protein [Streptomyces sp. NPDC058457]|uniref:hypothetical protein n=1 Tax=Streptomyces sp. NPDC058457 TaxID=3346507 RepID=UPI003661F508